MSTEIHFESFQKSLSKEFFSINLNEINCEDKIEKNIFKEKSYYEQKELFEKIVSTSFHNPNEWHYSMRKDMQEIIPRLFLGPYNAANKLKKNYLLQNGITHIICIRHESESSWIKPNFPDIFTYLTLNINDTFNQNIITFFQLSNRFILECINNNGKVLVHSNCGISRASTIVIAFIMFYFNCNSQKAIRFVQKFRFCIFPNESFKHQLKEYEPILKASLMNKESKTGLNRKRSLSLDKIA